MANGYGRGGVQVGGKGGTTLRQAYDFSPKAAEQYLTGELAGEYKAAKAELKSDLPTIVRGGKHSRRVESQIERKKKAKEDIGRLRDIASAQAVGEFVGKAQSMGRGSLAYAPKGLVSAEEYSPSDTTGIEAQTDPTGLGVWAKHQKRVRRGLGLPKGKKRERITSDVLEQTASALQERATASFGPGKSLGYSAALSGADPRAELAQQFASEARQKQARLAAIKSGPVSRVRRIYSPTYFGSRRQRQLQELGQSPQLDYLRG